MIIIAEKHMCWRAPGRGRVDRAEGRENGQHNGKSSFRWNFYVIIIINLLCLFFFFNEAFESINNVDSRNDRDAHIGCTARWRDAVTIWFQPPLSVRTTIVLDR